MGELDRHAGRVIRAVITGETAVITRYGRPAALILPLDDPDRLAPLEIGEGDLAPLRAVFDEREKRRYWSRILHGRWCSGGGIHGTYGRRPRQTTSSRWG